MTEVIMTKLDGLFFYNYQKIKIFNIGWYRNIRVEREII
jgi:hypothetical protein